MHSVTKNNRKNNKNKDLKTSKNEYFDPDSLKENKDAEDYLKGLAALTTVFGVGAAGLAFTPTKVHAAESTVDVKSQVVGSVSQAKGSNTEAKESLRSDMNSTSDAKSEANSSSDVKSESNSTSENTSTKGSTSESGSAKGNTSESNSTINSNSNSTKKSTSLTSNSEKHSENTSMSGSNASQSAIKSNLNSNFNSNLESNDNGSEITSYINSSSGSLANSLSEATAALDVTAFNQAAIARAFGTSSAVTSSVEQGTSVSTWDDFVKAINNGDKFININHDLDFLKGISIDHDVTINANGHNLYANDNIVKVTNSNSNSADLNVTVENANIYGTSTGTFSLYGNDGNVNLTLDNIQFTGGTLVWTNTVSWRHKFNLTFKGDNTVTAGEYNNTGTEQKPSYYKMDGATTQLYVGNGVKVADGASLTMNASDSVDYNIMEKGNEYDHSFIVGEGAKVTMTGTNVGNVIQDQYVSSGAWNNIVNFGERANVTMTAPTVNVLMNNGGAFALDPTKSSHESTFTINPSATVNLTTTKNGSSNGQGNIVITGGSSHYYSKDHTITSGDGNKNHTAEITIDKGANVTMSAARNSSNIISNARITIVNINDPDSVTLMNHGGQAYTAIGNNSNIEVTTTDARVTTTNINTGSTSSSVLNYNLTNYQSDSVVGTGDNTNVLNSIANSNTTKVTYIGKTQIEASESASTSTEVINSQSNSIAQSLSEANSINASMNSHNSALTSHSDSVLNSESENQSISTSLATSENASASLKNSENNSALTSKSIAESENASTNSNNSIQNSQNESALNSRSAVQSVAGSQSTSAANSALNSRSTAQSVAGSQSTSAANSALNSRSAVQSVAGSQSTSAANSALNSRSVAESTAASENASENASVKTSELKSTSAVQSVAGSQSTSAANSALNSRSVAESTAASENTSANASESVNDSGLQSQSIVDSGNQSISGSTSITSEGSLSGSTPVADSVSSTNNGDTDKLLPALDIVLTHNAYIYQNDGITTLKENGKNIVLKFGKTIHAMNNGQIFTFNGKKFYRIGDNQYVKVSDTISYYYLVHNSFLYNKHGKTIKRNGKRILVRKGVRLEANKVKVVKINGKKFYKVGKSTYIKFRNAKLIISPNN